jgi:hypothetical protein
MWLRIPSDIPDTPIVIFSHANRTRDPPVIYGELRIYKWGVSYICASQEGQFILNAQLKPNTFKSWTHLTIMVNNDGALLYVNRALKGSNFQMLAPAIYPFSDYDFIVAPNEVSSVFYDPRLPILPAGVDFPDTQFNSLPNDVQIAKFYIYPIILPVDYLRSKFRSI